MTSINAERLLSDLRDLAAFGKFKTGVDRVAFSAPDIAARRWLCDRLSEAGLNARMDRYANVLGLSAETNRAALVGSHTDSVPAGGWLDGALGVVYGLEIARSLREDGILAVDVVSFQDEEGSYVPCLGSKSFCGILDEAQLTKGIGPENKSAIQAIQKYNLPPETFRLDPARTSAFFEAHIEQGPRLEAAHCQIGVVTAIVGIRRFRITATGQADHAGTTPIAMRRDAGAALIETAHSILQRFSGMAGAETVWNIGAMSFSPGAANVVPALATMIVEFREVDVVKLDLLEAAVLEIVGAHNNNHGVLVEVQQTGSIEPVNLDRHLGDHIAFAARENGVDFRFLASGAGHDAMVVGARLPSAMLFVPSIGGRSHAIEENTADDDIIVGCRVLADAVRRHLQNRRIQS